MERTLGRPRPELLLALTGAAGFLLVALAVFAGNVSALDVWIAGQVNGLRTHLMTTMFYSATVVGNTDTLIVLSVVLLLAGVIHRPIRIEAMCMLVLLCAVAIGSEALKDMFTRRRPDAMFALIHETSWSFPSGHAMVSMALFGFLAFLARIKTAGATQAVLTAGCGLMIFLIGTSRVYLGVHYTSDVLAGWFAGIPVMAAGIAMYRGMVTVPVRPEVLSPTTPKEEAPVSVG